MPAAKILRSARTCVRCGLSFQPSQHGPAAPKYCSQRCRQGKTTAEARARQRAKYAATGRRWRPCAACGAAASNKFCPACRQAKRVAPARACIACAQPYWPRTIEQKVCSRSCSNRSRYTLSGAYWPTNTAPRAGGGGDVPPHRCRHCRQLIAAGAVCPCGVNTRTGYTWAERRRRKQAVEEHLELHGPVCPGWRRDAHQVDPGDLTADHAHPVAAGGGQDGALGVLCRPCNSSRGARLH